MLRTAINLKDAINQAPSNLSSLGTCYSIEREWKVDKGLEEESESEEESEQESCSDDGCASGSSEEGSQSQEEPAKESPKTDKELVKELDRFVDFIKSDSTNTKNTFAQSCFDDEQLEKWQFNVKIGNVKYQCPFSNIDNTLLERLYEAAPEAAYGNLKDMTTEVNPEVRAARDIMSDHFTVDPEMCYAIAKAFQLEFDYAGEVRVEPYKINLYGPGGCFKEHRDTPSKSLVGTFLVGLGDTSNKDAYLRVNNLQYSWDPRKWPRTSLGSWCTFYPDLVHEVTKVGSGLRANIAFKIFAVKDEQGKNKVDPNVKAKWEKLAPSVKKPFGVILSHDYSLNAETLKGSDKTYAEIFQGLGLKIKILPVLVQFDGTYDYNYGEYNKCSSAVYPLTEEALDYLLDKDNPEPQPILDEEMTFFSDAKGYQWYSDETPYCEYTGNECQPGEEDSLYLHRAMIIFPNKG